MTTTDKLYDLIEQGRLGKNIGLPTGLPKLDSYTGGTLRSTYYLYFGLSGSGKSSIVLYSHIYRPLKDNSDMNFKLIYYSLEMSAEVLLAKLLCLYIYEEYNIVLTFMDLLSKQTILDDDIHEYVIKSKEWLTDVVNNHLIIYDKSLSAESFYASMIENLKKWGSFKEIDNGKRTTYVPYDPTQTVACIIDHYGLVRSIKGRSKKQEIDELSSWAVSLREKCGISIFAIMQENRNSSSTDRRKMELSESSAEDIKDSGTPYNDFV